MEPSRHTSWTLIVAVVVVIIIIIIIKYCYYCLELLIVR